MKLFPTSLVLLALFTSFVSFAEHLEESKSVVVNPETEALSPSKLKELTTEEMIQATQNELKADESRMMKISDSNPKKARGSVLKAATTAADILYNITLASRARYSLEIYLKELNRRMRELADKVLVDARNGKKLKSLTAQIDEAERSISAAEGEVFKVKEQLRTAAADQEAALNVQMEVASQVLRKHKDRLAKLNSDMGALALEISRRQNTEMNQLADYIKDIKIRLEGGRKNPDEPELFGWNAIIEKSKKDLMRVLSDRI